MAEDSAVEPPKRKRGRPPKPDSEKVAPKRKAEADEGTVPKRGRGRPKGSKNKGSGNKKPASKGTVRLSDSRMHVRLLKKTRFLSYLVTDSFHFAFSNSPSLHSFSAANNVLIKY